jgi:hypothetical protein
MSDNQFNEQPLERVATKPTVFVIVKQGKQPDRGSAAGATLCWPACLSVCLPACSRPRSTGRTGEHLSPRGAGRSGSAEAARATQRSTALARPACCGRGFAHGRAPRAVTGRRRPFCARTSELAALWRPAAGRDGAPSAVRGTLDRPVQGSDRLCRRCLMSAPNDLALVSGARRLRPSVEDGRDAQVGRPGHSALCQPPHTHRGAAPRAPSGGPAAAAAAHVVRVAIGRSVQRQCVHALVLQVEA